MIHSNEQECRSHRQPRKGPRRRGSIMVLSAVFMIVFIAILALSVDLGYISNVRTELDRAVDASALAGAGELVNGQEAAHDAVLEYLNLNRVAGGVFESENVEVQYGIWDENTRTFTVNNESPSALRLVATRNDQRPLFFGKALHRSAFPVSSEAIAVFQPRDIVLVLDYSASMNDDSELKNIGSMGQATIEANLQEIYGELGSPVFGNMQWEPQFFSVVGVAPANQYRPQLVVQYRFNSVYLTSTKPFIRVRCYRSSGAYTQSDAAGTWNAATGVYEQTITYGSNQITRVEIRSGYNDSNESSGNEYNETFWFDTTTKIRNHCKNWFNLNAVAYPYPSGSWDSFIDYVRTSSNVSGAGYKYRFGYLTLVNYWLEQKPMYSQTPDLWQTSEQPITALKNAVTLFLSYIQEVDTDDRMGLSVYNSASADAILEQQLTYDMSEVEDISRHRQAGHYHTMTNIGAGLRVAIEEMDAHARDNAHKLIVLMTDGQANQPNNVTDALNYLMQQTAVAASKGYPVVTISLGAGADTDTMQAVADQTGGVHFNVPGNSNIDEMEEDLKDVFKQIADERPLQLVK